MSSASTRFLEICRRSTINVINQMLDGAGILLLVCQLNPFFKCI
ncbi:hypothetical protein T09_9469 [Trichinella sp. T9]|nr:hypothetical protein T09_9469 [Trichinella sp. T9]